MAIEISLVDEAGSVWRYARIEAVRPVDDGADIDVALYMDADAREADLHHETLTVRLPAAALGGASPTRAEIYAALKRTDLLRGNDI